MAAPRVDRRLAAIMAVDVVGYSRLIGADEAVRWRGLRPIASKLAAQDSMARLFRVR